MEAYVAYDPFHKRAGSLIVAINLQSEYSPASPRTGFLIAAGNTPSSHQPAMTLDTQMTLALL